MKRTLILIILLLTLTACSQEGTGLSQTSVPTPTNTFIIAPTLTTPSIEVGMVTPKAVTGVLEINYSQGISGLDLNESYETNWFLLENIPPDPKYNFAREVMEFIEQTAGLFAITGDISLNTFITFENGAGVVSGAGLVLWEQKGKLISQAALITSIDEEGLLSLITPSNMNLTSIDVNGHFEYGIGVLREESRNISYLIEGSNPMSLIKFLTISSSTGEVFWNGGDTETSFELGSLDPLVESGVDFSGLFKARKSDWIPDESFPEGEDVGDYLVKQFFYDQEYVESFVEVKIGMVNISGYHREAIIGVLADGSETILAAQVETFDGSVFLLRIAKFGNKYSFISPDLNLHNSIQVNETTTKVLFEDFDNVTIVAIPKTGYPDGTRLKWIPLYWDSTKPIEIIFVSSHEELSDLSEKFDHVSEKIMRSVETAEGNFSGVLFWAAGDGHGVVINVNTQISEDEKTWGAFNAMLDIFDQYNIELEETIGSTAFMNYQMIKLLAEVLKRTNDELAWHNVYITGVTAEIKDDPELLLIFDVYTGGFLDQYD